MEWMAWERDEREREDGMKVGEGGVGRGEGEDRMGVGMVVGRGKREEEGGEGGGVAEWMRMGWGGGQGGSVDRPGGRGGYGGRGQ